MKHPLLRFVLASLVTVSAAAVVGCSSSDTAQAPLTSTMTTQTSSSSNSSATRHDVGNGAFGENVP